MAGNLNVEVPTVSAQGSVGLPPSLRNALEWRANQHPSVVAIDAEIAASRKDPDKVRELKAQRVTAVAAAIRELVA